MGHRLRGKFHIFRQRIEEKDSGPQTRRYVIVRKLDQTYSSSTTLYIVSHFPPHPSSSNFGAMNPLSLLTGGLLPLLASVVFLGVGVAVVEGKLASSRYKSTCETLPSEIHITKGK